MRQEDHKPYKDEVAYSSLFPLHPCSGIQTTQAPGTIEISCKFLYYIQTNI